MLARGTITNPLFWLLPWALLALGCHATPRVSPQEARAIDQTPDAMHLSVGLQLENLDDEEIRLDQYTYTLSVENLGSFNGRWAALQTIPPGSSVTAELLAVIPIDRADIPMPPPDGRWAWQLTGNVRYEAPGLLGRVLFDIGIRRPSERFAGSGTVELPDLLQAAQPAQTAPTTVPATVEATASASP